MAEKVVICIAYVKPFDQNEVTSHSNLFHNCYNSSTYKIALRNVLIS